MPTYAFEIQDHHGFFEKLQAEHADYTANPESSRHAINFALTAWHLIDWVQVHVERRKETPRSLGDLRKDLFAECTELQVMGNLANGSKHVEVTRGEILVVDTRLHRGTFDPTFDDSFDTSGLEHEAPDGARHRFDNSAERVFRFWTEYFKRLPPPTP